MINEKDIDIISEIVQRLGNLTKEEGLTTGTIRLVSSSVFKMIKDKDINNVLSLCEELLDEKRWELGVVAYDWAFRMKK